MNPTLSATGIRAVVFDFGGVLFDWSPLHVYRHLIADDGERHRFLSEVCSPLWNVQQDAGRTLAEGTESLVRQHPQHESLIRAFYDRWKEMLRGPLDDGVTLLKDLHASGIPLFGLTNWSSETFPYARDNYDFLGLFQDIVVSGEEKCIKPDARIYEIALARYRAHLADLQPGELVFIDDLKMNVDAAQALGWHAIHHLDAARTRTELQDLGVAI